MTQLNPVLPELFMAIMACAILLVDLFLSEETKKISYWLTQATILGAIILTGEHFGLEVQRVFYGQFVLDNMAVVLKIGALFVSFFSVLYAYEFIQARKMLSCEYYVLTLFSIIGMMVLVSAGSLLTIYLGLELLSLPLYALIVMQKESTLCSEAGMKYFVMGAIASGLLLYGMSLLYGQTHSILLSDIAQVISASVSHTGAVGMSFDPVLTLGLVFLIVGVAFKLGAAPFHMWIPDVYHGAPTPIALFVSTVSKIAAFGMLIRLLVDTVPDLMSQWQQILMILALLSIVIGNVIALAQTNIKRLLAYSAISHVGFVLLGVLAGTDNGYLSAMFYMLVYALMAAGGFAVVILLSRQGFEAENLVDFRGLHARNPWYALMMMLFLLSMAGVPPTVGFYAKLAVLQAVVDVGSVWIAVFAVIFTVVGLFYYLRVIKLMYFEAPEDPSVLRPSLDFQIALSVNGLLMLLLGLFPGALLAICQASF